MVPCHVGGVNREEFPKLRAGSRWFPTLGGDDGGIEYGSSKAARILERMDRAPPSQVHGFWSSARSWMAESGVPAEVAEACLAHPPRSQVVQAYQRSDLLECRTEVMQAWSDCLG